LAKERGLELHFISAKTGEGVEEVMEVLWDRVGERLAASGEREEPPLTPDL
jgi:hypothetical protein